MEIYFENIYQFQIEYFPVNLVKFFCGSNDQKRFQKLNIEFQFWSLRYNVQEYKACDVDIRCSESKNLQRDSRRRNKSECVRDHE
jgi:hypothetical protein